MISETAYSCQTKLIGHSRHVLEHRIGYSNLAFAANKGQKKLIFSFKPLKCPVGLKIQGQSITTCYTHFKNTCTHLPGSTFCVNQKRANDQDNKINPRRLHFTDTVLKTYLKFSQEHNTFLYSCTELKYKVSFFYRGAKLQNIIANISRLHELHLYSQENRTKHQKSKINMRKIHTLINEELGVRNGIFSISKDEKLPCLMYKTLHLYIGN